MKKIIGFIICILLITTTGFSAIGIEEDNENELNENRIKYVSEHQSPTEGLFEWPMFRHDLNNTGYSPSLAPDTDNVLWSKEIGNWVDSNPTIKDERLYIVGDNYNYQGGANLWCLNPFTGAEIWKTNIPDEFVWGSPTVANDRVYVLGTYFNLYCYDANNGDLLWDFESNGHCGPMVVEDKLYFGCNAGDYKGFYCLNATTGEIIWLHDPTKSYPGCTPAIVDGKVYIGNGDGDLYCLDAETGAEIWSQNRCYQAAPSVFNNRVYTHYDKIYCLDAENGDEIWNYPNLDNYCSTAIAYGNVYAGSRDSRVYCFDLETGDLNWQSLSLAYICNDVAVADDKVFIPVGGHGNLSKFVCLDAYSGEVLWDYPLGGMYCIYSAPAVAYGNVYVGAGDNGYIFAFGTPNEPPVVPIELDGPEEGFVDVEYSFNISTTDPEGDDIYYLIDWCDGSRSGWLGPFASGATVPISHKWAELGEYVIKVKAHDGKRESNWSESHTIAIIGSGPDLECEGSLGWSDVKPGKKVDSNFKVSNVGKPFSHLDWEIESYPSWGDWSFDPQNGTDLTPEDDPFTVIVTVTAPEEKNSEFDGEVKIVNKENSSDFCTIDVSLTTPKNKAFNFDMNFLMWLFERFPNAFPILRYILLT